MVLGLTHKISHHVNALTGILLQDNETLCLSTSLSQLGNGMEMSTNQTALSLMGVDENRQLLRVTRTE